MSKTIYFTKRTRKQTILLALRESLDLVKQGKMDSRRFEFLLSQIKQFKKYEKDEEIKQIEKEFIEFKNHKKGIK